jgi:flavin-dependent dehydrogenase
VGDRRDPVSEPRVGIVGGGPAGSIVAALLARHGRDVVLFERSPAWRSRAGGVFSSPATVAALRRVGLDEAALRRAVRAIPAMRVETPGGARVRLTYGDDGSLVAPAVGFDRRALDEALLDLARRAGADVRSGVAARSVALPRDEAPGSVDTTGPDGGVTVPADVVVGADGPRSIVAEAAGVRRRAPLAARIGLTFHVPDPVDEAHDARMVVLRDAYVGLAPVPGGRLNVGIVLSGGRRGELRRLGAREVAAAVLDEVGVPFDPCDAVVGAAPLGHRVARRSGPGWLLAGDAAGFLDPFTGEGLHRAVVSAELAAAAVEAHLRGRRGALAAYDRAMARRFAAKDLVSLVVQAFLGRPPLLEYASRRLEGRDAVRETMGLVIGDLVPASRALDPRFLAALLRP